MVNKKAKINFSISRIFPNSRKAVSGVVTVVILIALAIAAGSLVWVFVDKTVGEGIEDSEACFGSSGNYGKVTINNYYTCYDFLENEVRFSIDIGDIEIDSLLISASAGADTKTFELSYVEQIFVDLKYLNGDDAQPLTLPSKKGGATYVISDFSEKPDSLQIAPTINNVQCGVTDSLTEIDFCS